MFTSEQTDNLSASVQDLFPDGSAVYSYVILDISPKMW